MFTMTMADMPFPFLLWLHNVRNNNTKRKKNQQGNGLNKTQGTTLIRCQCGLANVFKKSYY